MGIEKQLVAEKVKELQVKEYLNEALKRHGFSGAEIKRTPLGTRIILHVIRPGRIIGRGGSRIKQLTNILQKKFRLENPHIEVKEIETPELDPVIMAKRIAHSLERGYHFKRVGHKALTRMLELGATGAEISISGKVPGKRARTWKFIGGYIKHCGEAADVHVKEAIAVAYLKPGVVGIKVRIMPPGVILPDAILHKKDTKKQMHITEGVEDFEVEGESKSEKDETEEIEETMEEEEVEQQEKTEETEKKEARPRRRRIRDFSERIKEEQGGDS